MRKPTLPERKEEEAKRKAEEDYLARIKTVVPDLQPHPVVNPPLSCRLGFHKKRFIGNIPNSHHDIWVCLKCGMVEAGWGYVSLLGGRDFYKTYGYINPNKDRRLREEIKVKR